MREATERLKASGALDELSAVLMPVRWIDALHRHARPYTVTDAESVGAAA
jgi:hypothetical protein